MKDEDKIGFFIEFLGSFRTQVSYVKYIIGD